MSSSKDAYERYMSDVTRYPRITAEREVELSRIIQSADDPEAVESAVTELVQSNLLLVVHCLKEFEQYLSVPSVRITKMDLIAEGNIALMASARRYNAHYGKAVGLQTKAPIRFSAYACKSIKSRMNRAMKLARLIHIPEHHFSYWSGMNALRAEHGDELSDDLVLEELGISQNALEMLKQGMTTHACSLEDMVSDDGDSYWADVVADEDMASPYSEVSRSDLKQFLLQEMEDLPPRTRSMISVMYLNESAPTLREMSGMYGVSSERCRQVCARGLRELREQIERKCLAPAALTSCA
jgi:RNA polymerase sigma-32 factor